MRNTSNAIGDVINSLVPISRFNKGEASRIFDEVKETGWKIVLKNNVPACILITPEAFEAMREIVEDYYLLLEAEKRIANAKPDDYISSEQVMHELGISAADLEGEDVDIS